MTTDIHAILRASGGAIPYSYSSGSPRGGIGVDWWPAELSIAEPRLVSNSPCPTCRPRRKARNEKRTTRVYDQCGAVSMTPGRGSSPGR